MAIKCVNIVLDSCHVLDINLKLEIFGFLIPCRIKIMFYLCDIYYPLEKSYFKESCVSQYYSRHSISHPNQKFRPILTSFDRFGQVPTNLDKVLTILDKFQPLWTSKTPEIRGKIYFEKKFSPCLSYQVYIQKQHQRFLVFVV